MKSPFSLAREMEMNTFNSIKTFSCEPKSFFSHQHKHSYWNFINYFSYPFLHCQLLIPYSQYPITKDVLLMR